MALNYVTVTGTFDDGSGTALNGTVTFTPSQTVYSAGTPVVSTANPIVAQVINGALKSPSGGTLQLLATDNTGLSMEGMTGFWFWSVNAVLTGQSWSFFLPHLPASVDLYSLANTVASGGFINPMTTLGDIIYENATPAAARLAGNTTAVRQFLAQTGTGTVSAAPAWGAIATSDLPGALKPWQFSVDDPAYGAKGDGKIVADVVTNGTTTITSATASWSSADVNKHIMVNGANGTSSAPLMTTIASVTNSTTAVLAGAAGASATGCAAVWGSDDSSAINAAISAASTAAQAGNFLAEVQFGNKIYVTTTLTQQSSPTVYNTQLLVPYPAVNGQSRKLMVTLRGAGRMSPAQYWESIVPNVQGSAVVSMLTAPSTPDPTFGIQSVIGGVTGSGAFTGGFMNTHLTVQDLSVWCPAYTNIKALDMTLLSGCHLDGYSSNIFAPANNLSAATAAHPYLADFPAQAGFQNSVGIGIRFPQNLNNDSLTFGSVCVEGYEVGMFAAEHLAGSRYAALYCDVILKVDGGGSNHEVAIQSVSAEVYNGGILVTGSAGHRQHLNIGWDSETVGTPTYDISDSGNNAYGIVRWYDNSRTAPVVTGAANLAIVNDALGPGAWSGQPAVPASAVAQQNTSWRPASVVVTGGTVSAVSVDGVAQGYTATGFTVIVPPGKNVTLTYSAAPTWKWTLL